MTLYDATTAEPIGPATPEQAEASLAEGSETGIILIDRDGNVVTPGTYDALETGTRKAYVSAEHQGRPLTSAQLGLLKTYGTGNPVIWDAASFDIIVRQLMDLGLVQPAGPVSPRACTITAQGQEVLEKAGLLAHRVTEVAEGTINPRYRCTCGWEITTHYDKAQPAIERHLATQARA
jgi:hypothetical protein